MGVLITIDSKHSFSNAVKLICLDGNTLMLSIFERKFKLNAKENFEKIYQRFA